MAFVAYKTQAVGDPVIAADWNTYIRDNGNEGTVAKSTAAGDIVYATGANALARLGIGGADQMLRVSAGIPNWWTALPVSGYFHGAVGANRHVEAGSINILAGAATVDVTVTNGFSGPAFQRVMTPDASCTYPLWTSDISATQFRIHSPAPNPACLVYWIAEGSD